MPEKKKVLYEWHKVVILDGLNEDGVVLLERVQVLVDVPLDDIIFVAASVDDVISAATLLALDGTNFKEKNGLAYAVIILVTWPPG